VGDTVKLLVTKEWVVVPGLTQYATYSFQNVTDKNVYLQQAPSAPDATDIGFKVEPAMVAQVYKEASDIYVRSIGAGGLVYFNEVT